MKVLRQLLACALLAICAAAAPSFAQTTYWSITGAFATPNCTSGSFWDTTGHFSTPNGGATNYYRVDGHFASPGCSAGPGLPLGVNVVQASQYLPEQPFLNLINDAGSNEDFTGWATESSSGDTGEEAYEPLDSNGYPTSMTASPTPSGGQKYTYYSTAANYGLPSAPGASSVYPTGVYRLKFEGQGTLQLKGDAVWQSGNSCSNSSSTWSSSLTVTNTAANTYVTCTFTVSTASTGIILDITAISSSTDYPRSMSIVLNSQASNYDAGAIFNPYWLSVLANFSSVRFMQWQMNNGGNEFIPETVQGGSIAAGATSTLLTSAWNRPSGTYPVVFSDGEQRSGTFTVGSESVTWSGGVSNTITDSYGSATWPGEFFVDRQPKFANRPLPSNAFWNGPGGPPLEVLVALQNQLNADGYYTLPLLYSDADIESAGAAIMNGTGFQSGYSALSSSLTAHIQMSNEVWNSGYYQYFVAGSLGGVLWPSSGSGGSNGQWGGNWYGMRSIQMAADLQSTLSSGVFARVIPVTGMSISGGSYWINIYINTPYWTSRPSTVYIKAASIAPYVPGEPNGSISSTDCTTMTGVATPLDDFFAMMTGNVGTSANGSHTYSSVPSSGWLGATESQIATNASVMAGSSYSSIKLIGYEGGMDFLANSPCTGWASLVTSAERDTRMGTAVTSLLDYWSSTVGNGTANILEYFADVYPISQYGAWGLVENPMQTLTPLSSAPPKWAAAQTYMQ